MVEGELEVGLRETDSTSIRVAAAADPHVRERGAIPRRDLHAVVGDGDAAPLRRGALQEADAVAGSSDGADGAVEDELDIRVEQDIYPGFDGEQIVGPDFDGCLHAVRAVRLCPGGGEDLPGYVRCLRERTKNDNDRQRGRDDVSPVRHGAPRGELSETNQPDTRFLDCPAGK
ncbi:MAG: hypothetical protein BWY06_02957 [Candidatus Latescibacteria bacterium ADurb.Bin168]|nr:MAG: hypothetical protein BWY06_02957 [Candidatus Latescibacteria bacterium ADurb.Bin168]